MVQRLGYKLTIVTVHVIANIGKIMEFHKLTTNRGLITNSITINGDVLSIDIADATHGDGIGITKATSTFSISDIIAKFSQDHGCIALFPKAMNEGSEFIIAETTQLSLSEKVKTGDSYVSQETTTGKQLSGSPFSVISNRFQSYAYMYILTPSINCSPDDLIFVVRGTDSLSLLVNGAVPEFGNYLPSMKQFLDQWLKIQITGPTLIPAGSSGTYTVNAPPNTTVYLSSDIGVINRARTTNGGTFNLNTEGLISGEKATIKTGYKFWSGVSTFEVNIG